MNESENKGSENPDEKQSELKLTVKEAAQQIGESTHVIRNWLRELKGHIDTIKGENNYHYFDDKAIERLLLIQKLSREQGYSMKQIKYFLATGENPLRPESQPENKDVLLEEVQEMKEYMKSQQEFNKALLERLDKQERYINDSINRRDRELLAALDRQREKSLEEYQNRLESATAKEPNKKVGVLARLFGKK